MDAPLRIGLIGLDTSHVTAFTKLLNDPSDPHHVAGARVVAGFPGGSPDFDLSANRVEGFTKELREKWGVQILDSPAAVAEAADVVFIESVDGRAHLRQFRETLPFRRPTFIDKPLAVASADAREIFRLAAENGVMTISASSLRYDAALVAALAKPPAEAGGAVVGCDAYGPMALQPTQPGLFWYGIHTVDVLEAAMGPGCRRVSATRTDDFEFVVGTWSDGRVGTVRGHRRGHGRFGAMLHREERAEWIDLYASPKPPYASLLEAVLRSVRAGRSEIPPERTLEVIRFIEAANESRESGKPVEL